MPWIQLTFRTVHEQAEPAAEMLEQMGAVAVTYKDAEDLPILEPAPGETPLWPKVIVTGLFEQSADKAALLSQLQQSSDSKLYLEPNVTELEDQDWERAWMDRFKAMQFGEKLWICPSWQTPPRPEATNIILDPGLAFGTGTHPTTALCLSWLDQLGLADKTLVDFGCGSGVLAIAALRLGASQVLAIDLDPQALQATQQNAQMNGVLDERLLISDTHGYPEAQHDYLVANILAGPLRELALSFSRLVKAGGTICLSGLLAEQADEVMQIYNNWFTMDEPVEQDGWVRLSGTRNDTLFM